MRTWAQQLQVQKSVFGHRRYELSRYDSDPTEKPLEHSWDFSHRDQAELGEILLKEKEIPIYDIAVHEGAKNVADHPLVVATKINDFKAMTIVDAGFPVGLGLLIDMFDEFYVDLVELDQLFQPRWRQNLQTVAHHQYFYEDVGSPGTAVQNQQYNKMKDDVKSGKVPYALMWEIKPGLSSMCRINFMSKEKQCVVFVPLVVSHTGYKWPGAKQSTFKTIDEIIKKVVGHPDYERVIATTTPITSRAGSEAHASSTHRNGTTEASTTVAASSSNKIGSLEDEEDD